MESIRQLFGISSLNKTRDNGPAYQIPKAHRFATAES
jgi:hypothetical protein